MRPSGRRSLIYSAPAALLSLLMACGLTACGDDPPDDPELSPLSDLVDVPDSGPDPYLKDDDPLEMSGEGGGTGQKPARLPWTPCPLIDGELMPMVECVELDAPYDWRDTQDTRSMPLFVKRMQAVGTSTGQIWLLSGGPGLSMSDLIPLMAHLHDLLPSTDVYLLDHRGTGRSARMGCPDAESTLSVGGTAITLDEWGDCISQIEGAYADNLEVYTPTQAARDLSFAINRTRRQGEPVALYGVSYGTYWAMRYLTLYPDGVDAVVLDSLCPPGMCDMSGYDGWFDDTGHSLLMECRSDETCREKLGSNPMSLAHRAMDRLEAGECSLLEERGIDRAVMRRMLGAMLLNQEARRYIPSVLYRLARCDSRDVEALAHLHGVLTLPDARPGPPGRRSPVLFRHIVLSELWADPAPSPQTLIERMKDAVFSVDSASTLASLFHRWPRYKAGVLAHTWPETSVPILMLQGTLDPQTPLEVAMPAAERLSGAHQRLVIIPNAGHQTVYNSPMTHPLELHCGMQLMLSFLEDPRGDLDTRCLSDLAPLEFKPDRLSPMEVFGTEEMWENFEPGVP